jgi:hypothetical protein
MISKELAEPQFQIYTLVGMKNSRGHVCSSHLEICSAYTAEISLFRLEICMLFPMLTDEWLHLVLYHNSRQNSKILFGKYLVDISSEAWLNLLWEYIDGKLFEVSELHWATGFNKGPCCLS